MAMKAIHVGAGATPNLVETDRTLVDRLGQQVHGVIFTSGTSLATIPDLRVAPGTGHTVNVTKGAAVLREAVNPTVRGAYFGVADTDEVVSLPVPQSNPFFVAIVMRVLDAQYSGGGLVGGPGMVLETVSGTPAASPAVVTDAAISGVTGKFGAWIRLADVRINTGDSGAIPAGQITDTRKPGGFGIINHLGTVRPVTTGAYAGIHGYEMDSGNDVVWNGTSWVVPSVAPTAFTANASILCPPNTNYGSGPMTVTSGGTVITGSQDALTMTKQGIYIYETLFYIAEGGSAKYGWIGAPGDIQAQTPYFYTDRATLSRSVLLSAGARQEFGQRHAAGGNVTCNTLVKGAYFPVWR